MKRDERCVYCGCEFGSERARKRSWEHIINDINIATLENIALCCIGCNASKGSEAAQAVARLAWGKTQRYFGS